MYYVIGGPVKYAIRLNSESTGCNGYINRVNYSLAQDLKYSGSNSFPIKPDLEISPHANWYHNGQPVKLWIRMKDNSKALVM